MYFSVFQDGVSPVEEQQPEQTPYQENASLEIKAARASAIADSPVADSALIDSPVADSPVTDSPVVDSPVDVEENVEM